MYIRKNASVVWRGLIVIVLLETAPIACSLELPDRSCERDEDCLKGERCAQAFCLKVQSPAIEPDMQSDREMINTDQDDRPDSRSDQGSLDMPSDQFHLDQASAEMGAQDQMSLDRNITEDQAAPEMSLDDASGDDMAPTDRAPPDAAPADANPVDAGPADANPVDAGSADAGVSDMNASDMG